MLSVVWEVAGGLFAIDAAEVVEVVPAVSMRPVPALPAWVLGLADYHGRLIPVLDASALAGGRSAEVRLATRLVVVRVRALGGEHLVALQVERVRGIESIDFGHEGSHAGFRAADAPQLGAVVRHGAGTVQRFVVERLLEGGAADLLFGAAAERDRGSVEARS